MEQVLLIALVAAVDAGLLAAVVLLLGRPRPRRKLSAYWLGAFLGSTALGIVVVVSLGRSALSVSAHGSASPAVELAVGLVLLGVAAAVGSGATDRWHAYRDSRRKPRDDKPPKPSLTDRIQGVDSVGLALLAGLAYSVPGAAYLAGLALLVKQNNATSTDVLTIVAFNLIMFAFLEIPLLAFLAAPDRTRELTGRVNDWMARHHRTIVVGAAGALGLYLVVTASLTLL
jgi:hypothetical protein